MKLIISIVMMFVSAFSFAAVNSSPNPLVAEDPWIDVFFFEDGAKLQADTDSFNMQPYDKDGSVALVSMDFRSTSDSVTFVGVIGTKSCADGYGRLVVFVRGTEESDEHYWVRGKKPVQGYDSIAFTLCTALEVKLEMYEKQHPFLVQ